MAEGKKIEIKIAATGGDQAAAEIKKVSDAASDASNPANQKGFGGMLDGVPERADEVADAMEDVAEAIQQVDAAAVPLSKHLGEASDEIEAIGKASDESSQRLDKIANIQRAQVAAQLAQGLGMIGAKIREASEEFKDADPEFAGTLGNLSFGLESAASAANLAAQGFALGGPFGAAIGALVGAALPSLNAALGEMTEALAGAAASEAQAAEMLRRYHEELSGLPEAARQAAEASEDLAKFYDDETAAVDRLIGSMEQRNKLLDANDKADRAARDRSDARRIRAGEDPETVKQDRVNADEAAALAKVDRDIADKRTGLRETKNAAITAGGELGGLKVNGSATPEQLAAAEKIVAELEAKVAKMEAAVAEAEALAGPKKREIRETAAGKGEALAAQRRERQQAEAQRAAEQQAAAEAKAAKAAEDAERDAGRDKSRNNSAAAKAGNDASRLIPKDVSAAFRKQIERVTAGLQDGDQGGELDELVRLMGILAAAVEKRDGARGTQIANLAAKIDVLSGQIKTNRTGQ